METSSSSESRMNFEQEKIQVALKKLMKQNKVSYESLARELDTSTATIKRRLNGDNLSIGQIREIADAFDLTFYELIDLSKKNIREPYQFTIEQEKLFASDINYVHLFRYILCARTWDEIKNELELSEDVLRKMVRKLEEVQLAQLLPKDRIQTLVHFPFRWHSDGPLRRTYHKLLINNLIKKIQSDNDQVGLKKQFELSLSEQSYRDFCREALALYVKYRGISEHHLNSPQPSHKFVSGLFYINDFSIWS